MEQVYSSIKRRFFAYCIDVGLLYLCAYCIIVITVLLFEALTDDDSMHHILVIGVFIEAFIIIGSFLLKDLKGGISFGKWVMGIRVVMDQDHTKVPMSWKLIVRTLLMMVVPFEFIPMFDSDKNQRLADNICKTVVIMDNNRRSVKYRLLIFALAYGALFTTLILCISWGG